jgi:D-inositol-3-phosphate glycosyltransferase
LAVTGKLRICILSVHSSPVGNIGARDTGGMSVYINELARELGILGHSVDIYTRAQNSDDSQVLELSPGVRLIHLKAGEEAEMHKLVLYSYLPDFACNTENFRKNNGLKYDLIFSHYWLSGWVGKYLQQWWQVPHFVMFHTLGDLKNSLGIGEDEPDLRLASERETVSLCDRIIATTATEKHELVNRYGASSDKIEVIPCGVNLQAFYPVDKKLAKKEIGFDGGKLLLFVGRIEPLKGIEQLIRAMKLLKNIRDLRLLVIGGDEDSHQGIERLEKLAFHLNIHDSVNFLGLIKHERLNYYYSAADVCVIPSYYESFGLVALESLACGTPVVANNVGYISHIIRQGETGYVIPDNSPGRLSDKISLVLSDSNISMKSPALIRETVAEFDWPHIAEAVVGDFRRVLARPIKIPVRESVYQ